MSNIMKNSLKKLTLASVAVSLAIVSTATLAKVSSTEIAKLSKELTPIGAVRAANKDGSIPAWNGGITSVPAGYTVGDHHIDPFSTDKVKYTITAANVGEYKAMLTPGQIKLFE
ncbi:MAG: hypothetical protein ACJA0T_003214, partial [Colwellia sp.]